MANPGVTITIGQPRRAPRPVGNTIIGIVGDAPNAHADFPAQGPGVPGIYLVNNIAATLADPSNNFGDTGSIKEALEGIDANSSTSAVVVRVADRNASFTSPSPAQLQAAIKSLEGAQSQVGSEPHLICCPDFTYNRAAANPYAPVDTASTVMTQLNATAEVLDAIAVVTGHDRQPGGAVDWQLAVSVRRRSGIAVAVGDCDISAPSPRRF